MPQYGYGYLDMGDGYALVQIQPGQRQGMTFFDGNMIKLKGHVLKPVARKWLQIRRAPTVIWKPGASPDVTNAVDVEMVDLSGGDVYGELGADAPATTAAAPSMVAVQTRPGCVDKCVEGWIDDFNAWKAREAAVGGTVKPYTQADIDSVRKVCADWSDPVHKPIWAKDPVPCVVPAPSVLKTGLTANQHKIFVGTLGALLVGGLGYALVKSL